MQKSLKANAILRFAHVTIPLKGHDPPRESDATCRVSQKIRSLATNFPDLQEEGNYWNSSVCSDKLEVAGTHPVCAMYTMGLGAKINIISYGH